MECMTTNLSATYKVVNLIEKSTWFHVNSGDGMGDWKGLIWISRWEPPSCDLMIATIWSGPQASMCISIKLWSPFPNRERDLPIPPYPTYLMKWGGLAIKFAAPRAFVKCWNSAFQGFSFQQSHRKAVRNAPHPPKQLGNSFILYAESKNNSSIFFHSLLFAQKSSAPNRRKVVSTENWKLFHAIELEVLMPISIRKYC